MKQGERGFTLIEILVATTIIALIANGAMLGIFQVLRNTERDENYMTAVNQVENASYWISLDAQKAQIVEAEELETGERTVIVSWGQDESGYLESDDYLYFAFSDDGGSTWGSNIEAFHGNDPPSPFSYTIPDEYLASNFRMRFYLQSFGGYNEYAYIDDIAVSETIFSDDCSSLASWDNGADWDIYYGEFRGHHYNDPGSNRYLTMNTNLDLAAYQGETVTASWKQGESGDLEESGQYVDILYFAFSGDGGGTWSSDVEAFTGDYTPLVSPFNYTIPDQYLTDDFRMRFYLNGPDGWIGDDAYTYEYAYIDNIAISVPIFSDDCSSLADWNNGEDWDVSSGEFRGHHLEGGGDSERYLTMSTDLDLTSGLLAGGFPLTFTWTTWSGSGGTEYQVTYSIVNDRLMRSCSIDGGTPVTTYVAEYIDLTNTACQFAYGKLTFRVTAAVGGGPEGKSETREFQVLTRPD